MPADHHHLTALASGRPGLTSAVAQALIEAAAVCFEAVGHQSPVTLRHAGEFSGTSTLAFPSVTEQMRNSHTDLIDATERGACAIAAHLCERQLGLTIVQQSRRGQGFDYWIAASPHELFQAAHRLEVSGILRGDSNQVKRRLSEKLQRLANQEAPWTTWVIIVEFAQPLAHAARR